MFASLSGCLAASTIALFCVPALAGTRAFVSSTGNDANMAAGCTLAAPCRTFQTAHTAVDTGGEIIALDAAGYAPLTITKSVTVMANPGVVAGIAAAAGDGVIITGAGVDVVLRGLNITGTGASIGVFMNQGNSVSIENCVISGFTTYGVSIAGTGIDGRIINTLIRDNGSIGARIAATSKVEVINSQFIGNGGTGLNVSANLAGTTSVSVVDSVASGNNVGFSVAAFVASAIGRMSLIRSTAANNVVKGFTNEASASGATALMVVGSSMATGNGTGFFNSAVAGATATFESLGNNLVRHNAVPTSGTITTMGGI